MSVVATSLLAIGLVSGSGWAGGPPGKEISLVNMSQLTVASASAFHRVAVSRRDPNLVAAPPPFPTISSARYQSCRGNAARVQWRHGFDGG